MTHLTGEGHRRLLHLWPDLGLGCNGGAFLDDLLETALDAAVATVEGYGVACYEKRRAKGENHEQKISDHCNPKKIISL
jgi:hypothetical protein